MNAARLGTRVRRSKTGPSEAQPLYYGSRAYRLRDALIKMQGGRCCICRGHPPFRHSLVYGGARDDYAVGVRGKFARLWIDHDHETRMVRGLLCPDCNAAIMPLEFAGGLDAFARCYLGSGARLRRAREHLCHVVMATDTDDLRVVSLRAPEKRAWTVRMSRCCRCGRLVRGSVSTLLCGKCLRGSRSSR